MTYRIAPLPVRPWTLNGVSPELIESHYEFNYGSALRRLNAVTDELAALDLKAVQASALSRLKREQAELLNSTLLHELYFASLGGDGRAVTTGMTDAITRDFGSVDRWRAEFIALAEALGGGAGWIVLTYVPRDGHLINISANDHNQGVAGGIPVLALDMYEHAYHLEWGANAVAYVAAFMRNIDWVGVERRYALAANVPAPPKFEQPEFADMHAVAPEDVQAILATGQTVQMIDTRPRHYTTKANDIVAGAVWRDPEKLDEWIGTLDKDVPVVTFAFTVSTSAARALPRSAKPVSTPAIWPAATTPGRRSRRPLRCSRGRDGIGGSEHCAGPAVKPPTAPAPRLQMRSIPSSYYFHDSGNTIGDLPAAQHSARMKIDDAAARLEALGNPTRLKILRPLVRAGDGRLSVGKLQLKLDIAPSRLSHHLKAMLIVGLIDQERQSTTLICRANHTVMRSLVDFMVAECCADTSCSPANRKIDAA